MGQDLGKLRGLRVVHVGDTDSLPVTQYGQQHLDAHILKRLYIGQITIVFQQVGHLVVQIERRLYHAVYRPLVDIRGKKFHNAGKRFAVGELVVSGVERIGIVGFDVDDHYRRIAIGTGFGNCALIHRRVFGLLA